MWAEFRSFADKAVFEYKSDNTIFVVTTPDLLRESNAMNLLAMYKGPNRLEQTVSKRLQDEYGRRTFFGKVVKAVTSFSLVDTDLTGYLDAACKAILYDNLGKVTFALVELTADEKKENRGKKYKIVPVKEGAQLEQQLGSVEQVLALSLLKNKESLPIYKNGKPTGEKENVLLEEIMLPRQTSASISKTEVLNNRDSDGKVIVWNYGTSGTMDGKLEPATLGVEVLRLGSISNAEYFANVVKAGEDKAKAYEKAQKRIGKRVIIDEHGIEKEAGKTILQTKADFIAEKILDEYLATGTAQLFILEDVELRDAVSKGLEDRLGKVDQKDSVKKNRADYLLKLIKNKRENDNKPDDERKKLRAEAKKILDEMFGKVERFEKIRLKLEYGKEITTEEMAAFTTYKYGEKETTSEEFKYLGKADKLLIVQANIEELKAKVRGLADKGLIQLEIIGEMSGDLLHDASKYIGLTQGLVITDIQGGTGTDYSQTLNTGITLHLADTDVLTDEDLAQWRGRVARREGNESVIHEYYDKARMLMNLKNDLGVEAGAYEDFERARTENIRIDTFYEMF